MADLSATARRKGLFDYKLLAISYVDALWQYGGVGANQLTVQVVDIVIDGLAVYGNFVYARDAAVEYVVQT